MYSYDDIYRRGCGSEFKHNMHSIADMLVVTVCPCSVTVATISDRMWDHILCCL